MTYKLKICFLFFVTGVFLNAQNIDSLKLLLQKTKADTIRCRILLELAENASDKEWPGFNGQLKNICELNLKDCAPKSYLRGFYLKHLAAALNNNAYLARLKGDLPSALEGFSKSLKMREEISDTAGTAESLNNLADIYESQGEKEKALGTYNKSLQLFEKIKDKTGMAYTLNNIGLIYKTEGQLEKALLYYKKSLDLRIEEDDKEGIASSLNNIGSIYFEERKYDDALKQYQECLAKYKNIEDREGIAYSLNNISAVYLKQKKYSEAIKPALESLRISKEAGFAEDIRNAAEQLYQLYSISKKHKTALEYFELFVLMRDSINNEQTKKAAVKTQLKYEYEKKAAADSVKNAEQQKVKDAQLNAQTATLKQEKFQRYSLLVGLSLVICGLLFVINRFRITQKQKKIIEEQKIKVDEAFERLHEKNKEVMDSIQYAKRIQTALLTNEKYIGRNLDRMNSK